MKKRLEAFLLLHMPREEQLSDNEKYLHMISFLACTYAVSMQFFLLIFHLATGVLPLFYVYLSGFLIDFLLFWLVRKRHYLPFGILLTLVVIVETLLSAVCIGTDNFIIVYLLVTIMMQIIIPYARTRVRVLMTAALYVSMIALVLINHYMVPTQDIGVANASLAFFNIHLAFFGTIIQLTIGTIIWDVIRKANQAKLDESRTAANTDPLTGLLNRRYATTFFKMLTSGQLTQEWCVAMLDIDDFKVLNDTYGHKAGDGVLMFISDFLKTNLRRRDLVFRWGGEEFLILLKDIDVVTAFNVLDKLRGRLASENIETHDLTLNVTVTIGVCPLDPEHIDQSIDTCDRLMYKGKDSGKNMVVM